jgi:hypothetical protein
MHYVLADNWFRPQGCTGIYLQSYDKGLWSPECAGNSYGTINTYGSGRNGWHGWGIGSRYVLMSTLGDNMGAHDNSRGWIWYMDGGRLQLYWAGNRRMVTEGHGVYFDADARASIFYDHDTSFYFDGNGTTRWQGIDTYSKMRIGLTGRNNFRRNDITGNECYWTGVMGWGTTDLISVFDWGAGFIDTWSSPANRPPVGSHYVGIQSSHYNCGYNNGYGFQLVVADSQNGAWYTAYWPNKRPWYKLAMYGLNENSSDLWSSIMYDSNDSSWYVDPSSTSQLQFTEVRRYGFRYPGGDSGLGADAYNLFQEGGGWGFPFPDLRIAYHTGVKLGANASYEGFRIYDDYPMGTIRFQFNGSSGYQWQYTWTNLTGHHGIYSNINSAHFYPNDASYGSWRILGTRNGWHGIHFGGGNGMTLMMNEGEFGFHREGVGWTGRFTSGTGYFSISGNASDINTSNITRAPQYGGQNFNNLTGFSFCASAVADANGPFGNGFWYNIVNVRHQGGVGDGNVWGLQIAAGMTNQARRIAFRTHVAGNWEPWAEFSHSLSDANFKVEDGFIENGIDLVMRLKPRYYYWKNYRIDNPERRAGFFAQEVHEVSPESAIEPASDSAGWGVEDRGLIAILTKAIQEQQVLIQQMQEEINNLKNR